MTQIALPTATWRSNDPRASSKRLVNVFSEGNPPDSKQDSKQWYPNAAVSLRRWAGTETLINISTATDFAVRGIWEMQGIIYVVAGTNLYSYDPSSNTTILLVANSIEGSGLVRMTDNTACLVILVPKSFTAYTYVPGTGFAAITASTFTSLGALDCWFVDSYIVFLANNGREFFNDDGQATSGSGPITFNNGNVFGREFGTDLLIGGTVDHREVLLFAERSAEGFVNAGNPVGTPFSSAPSSYIELGAHPDSVFAIAKQDQSVFWVANDRTVRRRNGQTPMKVSTAGIEAILETANMKDCYALCPTVAGHPLYVLTMPHEPRSLAYDCATQEWFEISSYGYGYWRASCYLSVKGYQLIGDGQGGSLGFLNSEIFTEFGNPIVSEIVTQSIYQEHHRMQHRRLEIVATPGRGQSYMVPPTISLYKSNDSGMTFNAMPGRSLGLRGDYKNRAVWWNLGQSRDRCYKFSISDPTELFTVDITTEVEQGRW